MTLKHSKKRLKALEAKMAQENLILTEEQLQADLDVWLKEYNEERTHSGKYCYGKTPMQTFIDSLPMTKEKMIGSDLQSAA